MGPVDLSLRKHIIWILLVKLVVIVTLKMTLFPSLKEQHRPADLYFDSPAEHFPAKEHP